MPDVSPAVPLVLLAAMIVAAIVLYLNSSDRLDRRRDDAGDYYRVPIGWRGIADFNTPHVFCLEDDEEYGIGLITYPISLHLLGGPYFGHISQQRLSIGGNKPIEYHDWLIANDWQQMADRQEISKYVAGLKMSFADKDKEQWLKHRGWEAIDYPFPRGHRDYKYTVYCHPPEIGVWALESAVEQERIRMDTASTSNRLVR